MTGLPPLDTRPDGVLASLFDDGILLFNRNAKAVSVELTMPAGRWDVDYPGLPRNVTLPPVEQATGARVSIGGTTASNLDFSKVIRDKLPLFIGVIILLPWAIPTGSVT